MSSFPLDPKRNGSPRPAAGAFRYGSAMLRRFGWFYWLMGLGRSLGRIRLEEHSAEQIRVAAERGPIVYVLPRRSAIDHLALNTVLNQRRLPLSAWASGVTSFWWQPVAAAWRDVAHRVRQWWQDGAAPDPIASGWLSRSVAQGLPVTVFVNNTTRLAELLPGDSGPDALQAILDAQQLTDKPIQLVPALIVWDRAPEMTGSAVQWFISGIKDPPGFLGQLYNAWVRSQNAFVQVGEPIDLAAFSQRFDAARRPKALRLALRRYLHRESTLIRGPRLPPYSVMKRVVLENPPMRDIARKEAEASGRHPEAVQRQMSREYDKMAAHFRWWVIRILDVVLRPLWTKIYAGVDVRPEDIERIRAAMRAGGTVLIPSHKSHFDYLLLSWVFYANDLIVPHVVAGMNLAIWPVSIILRGAGGFFIKRSFSGDKIFPAVFSRYLRELIRQNFPVEFFIEGGRTRSGKLMAPKLGVLGMVFEAAEVRRTGQEVTLLPIALAYEQVAEEASYARELGGEAKKAESVGQLVKASSVLRRRYGRVYMRVGEPIPTSALVDGPVPWHARERADQKLLLQHVGERVIYRIGLVTVVLPTSIVALALLAHHRRGLRNTELLGRVERFRAFLLRAGALEAASLHQSSQAVHDALGRFLREKLVEGVDDAGERAWAIAVEKRITLDFHKNQVLHFFATAAMCAAAIRTLPEAAFTADDVLDGFTYLAKALRSEFVLDPDRLTRELMVEGLDALVAHGALEGNPHGYTIANTSAIAEIHALIRSILEGYAYCARAVAVYAPSHGERDLPRELQLAGEKDGLGIITRPESLSLVTLQNAVGAFVDEQMLRERDGRLAVDPKIQAYHLDHLLPMVT